MPLTGGVSPCRPERPLLLLARPPPAIGARREHPADLHVLRIPLTSGYRDLAEEEPRAPHVADPRPRQRRHVQRDQQSARPAAGRRRALLCPLPRQSQVHTGVPEDHRPGPVPPW